MVYSSRQQREIFHLLFLSRLQKVSDPHLYVLKGGINLRFFFNSPRYSEDMDLDVLGGAVPTLKKNGYAIIESEAFKRSLRTYGISDITVNDPQGAKHTKTTQRFRLQLITEAGEALPTKVEFSRRGIEDAFVKETINPQVVRSYNQLSFTCQHYTGAAATQQKLKALAHRSAVQARDVFDIYMLYLGGHIPPDIAALHAEEQNQAIEQLLSLDFNDYGGHVLEFLLPEDQERFGHEGAWIEMQMYVLSLLEQAS